MVEASPRSPTAAAIDLLLHLAAHIQGAGPATLADETGWPQDRVRRQLVRLKRLGCVEKDPMYPGRYRLTDRMAMLGAAGRYVELRQLARPHLKRLHEAIGTPVTIHVNTGVAQAAIDRYPYAPTLAERQRELRQFGDPVPLRAGSTAKVILAFLPEAEALAVLERTAMMIDRRNQAFSDPAAWVAAAPSIEELREIRRKGYAVSLGERTRTGRAMSAPVFERGGRVCAALCLYGGRERVPDEDFFRAAPLLMAEAAALSAQLGASGSLLRPDGA
jgi:DNA-binding IclR family transcriptional regulator